MKVNRLDWLRVLKIVKSVGANEVKFDEQGRFSAVGGDGSMLLFGQGLSLYKEIALMDVDMLIKMLDAFVDAEINVEIKDSKLMLGSEGLVFGYRLALPEVVESIPLEKKEELLKGQWVEQSFYYEQVVPVNDLIKTLTVHKVSFVMEEGRLVAVVGDRKRFYGQLYFGNSGLSLPVEFSFDADKLKSVFDVVDNNKVIIGFKWENEGNIVVPKIVKIEQKDFCWFIGALTEKE